MIDFPLINSEKIKGGNWKRANFMSKYKKR